MPYLNLDLEYFSHRKVVRLCAQLGQWAETLPLRLWVYVGKHHPEDGLLIGYSASELLALIGFRHPESVDANSILAALQDKDFVMRVDGGWAVHEWLLHQGHIAAFAIRGRENANKRWAKIRAERAKNATSIPKGNAPTDPTYLPTESVRSGQAAHSLPLDGDNPHESTSSHPADTSSNSLSSLGARPKKEKPARGIFIKPTLQEVANYLIEINSEIDPRHFIDSNEAKGWKVGKTHTPMADWKAVIRTWVQRGSNRDKEAAQASSRSQGWA